MSEPIAPIAPSVGLVHSRYLSLIDAAAQRFTLDPLLVQSLIWVESRGQTDAFRFEPLFYERYKLASKEPYIGQPARRVSSSYGLMQLMYPTAWDLGFRGEPEELFVPRVNLHWGCRLLRSLVLWAEGLLPIAPDITLRSALAAYNGGRGGNSPLAELRPANAQYAEKVLAALRTLQLPAEDPAEL